VHDVLNVFQVTGLTPDGRYFVKASPARKGDFLEFFAEMDVLCAISVCPHGDLSVACGAPTPAIRSRRAGRSASRSGAGVRAPEGLGAAARLDYGGAHGLRSA